MATPDKTPESTKSSRREFLRASVAAVSSAAVSRLDISRTAYAAGSDVIKVGLIGSGDRGSGAALNAMNADPGVRLVAMADLFVDRIQEKRKLLQEQKPKQMAVDDDRCFVGFDGHRKVIESSDVTQSLVHNLDKATWALREATPIKAHGLGGRSSSVGDVYGDVFDHHSVVYEYANGVRVYAFCRTQVGCHGDVSDIILGTKGRCDLLKHRIDGESKWRYGGPQCNPYDLEHQALFSAIRSGTPINSGDYMARSTMVANLGQLACYSGRQITWEEACQSNFAFEPEECDFHTTPPVRPGPDGNYPTAVPGRTKFI